MSHCNHLANRHCETFPVLYLTVTDHNDMLSQIINTNESKMHRISAPQLVGTAALVTIEINNLQQLLQVKNLL